LPIATQQAQSLSKIFDAVESRRKSDELTLVRNHGSKADVRGLHFHELADRVLLTASFGVVEYHNKFLGKLRFEDFETTPPGTTTRSLWPIDYYEICLLRHLISHLCEGITLYASDTSLCKRAIDNGVLYSLSQMLRPMLVRLEGRHVDAEVARRQGIEEQRRLAAAYF
jgi:hypothetical protein